MQVLSIQCLQLVHARSANPGYSVRSFPFGPKFPWLGFLVDWFTTEDKVAYLEVAVLYVFVEVLRDSLFISSHLEIRLFPSFLNQVQVSAEGFGISHVVVVHHSVGRLH